MVVRHRLQHAAMRAGDLQIDVARVVTGRAVLAGSPLELLTKGSQQDPIRQNLTRSAQNRISRLRNDAETATVGQVSFQHNCIVKHGMTARAIGRFGYGDYASTTRPDTRLWFRTRV